MLTIIKLQGALYAETAEKESAFVLQVLRKQCSEYYRGSGTGFVYECIFTRFDSPYFPRKAN